jgi:bacteriocin-like protein
MSAIQIKDLEDMSNVRELTNREMQHIQGGQGPDIGGYDTLHTIVDTIVAPIDLEAIQKWANQQAGK